MTSTAPTSNGHADESTNPSTAVAPSGGFSSDFKSPFPLADRILPEVNKLDVWTVFSPAGGYVPKDSVNLGQGFMSWLPPTFIRDAATHSLNALAENNHYSHPRGRISLREALADHISDSFGLGRRLDPGSEIIVTAGANEGIYSWLTAFVQEGDQVILLEPAFDQYVPNIRFNNATPIFIPIRPPSDASSRIVSASEWKVDPEELREACRKANGKMKAIILNTPHNPIGKVFTTEEIREIGKVAEEFDLVICADEVYDELAFAPAKHVRVASVDDLWKRTITIGSAGKTFACTGWRVGWAAGPEYLIRPTLASCTRIVFATNTPLQEAAAIAYRTGSSPEIDFFNKQRDEYIERRTVLREYLDELGLNYTVPDGAYFCLVESGRIKVPEGFELPKEIWGRAEDWKVCWFVVKTCGVVTIPPTEFYSKPHWDIGAKYIRISFAKDVELLHEAGKRLLKLKPYIKA